MNCQQIDALIALYLSGELDGAQTAEFAAHLESCAACERDILQQRELDRQLREGILAQEDALDDVPVMLDSRIRRSIADSGRIRRGKWIAVASLAAMLTIAIGGFRFIANRDAATCADAARDHRMEVVGHAPRKWATDPPALAALATKQGIPQSAIALVAPPNYHLERGKLCRLGGRVFLHLVYSDGSHEFSFYLRDRAPGSRAVANDAEREYVVMVESSRYMALVVTDESRDAARDIARFASRSL